jgi:hypothetical protein
MIYRVPVAQSLAAPGFEVVLPRPAKGIRVLSGSPGVRIFLNASQESFVGEISVDAVTGLCVARDFTKVYVHGTVDGNGPDVIFEALECCPAVLASNGRSHAAFVVAFEEVILAGDEVATRNIIATSEAFENLKPNDDRVQPLDFWYLAGAISANATFTLRLWARVTASVRVLVASLQALNADPDGLFGCALETGWRKDLAVAGTFTSTPIPLSLPWELEIYQPTGVELTINGIVFLRDV